MTMKKTYEKNLTVDFIVPFLSIKDLQVTSGLGDHVTMELKAVVEKEKYQQYIEAIDSGTTICIEYLGGGVLVCLFQGYIGNVGIDLQGGTPLLILSCLSFTGKMDTTSKKRGFFMEGTGLSHVIKEMEREYGRFQVKTDQVLPGAFPGPVMQYNETDWGFLKRLASLYKWDVLADGSTGWPSIVLGKSDIPVVPVEGLEGGNGTIERRGIGWKDGSPVERMTIQSMEYYHPGSRLQIPGLPIMAIYKMRTYLKQEVLYHEYVLVPEGSVGTQPMGNKNIVGKRLGGVVQGHKGESVSILLDIDKGDVAIGQGKDLFFPFNLEVSGMRDLPEIGGRIHLYFPSIWEWEGEVVSAERTICTFRPGQKVFRHIEGAGIELDENHIQLHGGGEKEVYVQLGEDGDIYIQGDNIMLGTDGGILPCGGSSCRDLRLNAKRAILVRRTDGQKEGAQCGHFIGLKGIVQIKAPGEIRHETDSKGRTSMETMGKEGGDENGVLKVSAVRNSGNIVMPLFLKVGKSNEIHYKCFRFNDVKKHKLILETNGKYICEICRRKFEIPEKQDIKILSKNDMAVVTSLLQMLEYTIAVRVNEKKTDTSETEKIIYNEIHNIRSKYKKKYDYSDEQGNYIAKYKYPIKKSSRIFVNSKRLGAIDRAFYTGTALSWIGILAGILVPDLGALMTLMGIGLSEKVTLIDALSLASYGISKLNNVDIKLKNDISHISNRMCFIAGGTSYIDEGFKNDDIIVNLCLDFGSTATPSAHNINQFIGEFIYGADEKQMNSLKYTKYSKFNF